MDSNGEAAGDVHLDDDTIKGERLARAEGRSLVRHYLIEALDGLGPRRGQTLAEMRVEQEAVADRLSYMSPENLRALAECALRMAGTLKAGQKSAPAWPEPAQLYAWAFVLQFPPPRSSDYIPSLMRSRLGDEAMAGGWHVQLYRHARRGPPPPNDYLKSQLRDRADEDRRQLRIATEFVEAGRATSEHRRLLDAWHRDKAEAEALVEAGRAARAAAERDQSQEGRAA